MIGAREPVRMRAEVMVKMTDSNGAKEGRDNGGRFRRGNAGGPGNPHLKRLAAHQAAVREALTPKQLKDVLKKLHELAMGGDVAAARVVLERVVGKSRLEPEPIPTWTFDPKEIQSERGRARAVRSILSSVAEGRLPPGDGTALVGFIEAASGVLPPEFLEPLDPIEEILK